MEKQRQALLLAAQKAKEEPIIITTTITTVKEEMRKVGTSSKTILAEVSQGPPPIQDNFDRIHVHKIDGVYHPKDPELTLEQVKVFTHTKVHEVDV